MRHAKVAKLFFDIHQSYTGSGISHKTTKKPHLAHVQPMAKVAPISTVQSTSPVDQSASGVKAEGKELPKMPDSKEDCPF
jgi:hypothetical protein